MSRIRGKDTKPEILARKLIHSAGGRFRLHDKKLPGKPDIVLSGRKLAIFVHGCFWHRHQNCKRCTSPKTRVEFWESKFASNIKRDQRNLEELQRLGWTVEVIWECETSKSPDFEAKINDILAKNPLT